ncbi:unnamed protein product [Dovyalis caffra]|uniref:Uncharacterized protein n=1 Tax=Dovyalis caffra TaxID=77055 RepID=A0AAV1RUA4_9ROSI|nr:unnamed protein product [Dovyalis caffra]
MTPAAPEQKMGFGVCSAKRERKRVRKGTFDNDYVVEIVEIKEDEEVRNAGEVCDNEAAATFTDSDTKLRPFAAVGDGTVRVEGASNNVVVLALCALPVKGTDLIEDLASDPLPAVSEVVEDYPTDYWSETFPKMLLQGIPEISLKEKEIDMIPNRFYFDYFL